MEAEIVGNEEEWAKAGMEIYLYMILPFLKPEDRDKYVALDIDSALYEVDADSAVACERLKARRPQGRIWTERVGDPEATRWEYRKRIANMTVNAPKREPKDDWSTRGEALYKSEILPLMKPEDQNMYVAIDIDSGQYEIDPVSIEACVRLKAKIPESRIWVERVGHCAAGRRPRARRIDWI